jgi:quercetin dioxygenase-like cupin family protein
MARIDRRRIIGEKMMISQVFLSKGFDLASHRHENEQFVVLVSGRCLFGVGDEGGPGHRTIEVRAGEVLHLPGNVAHSCRALEDTQILDLFSPISEVCRLARGSVRAEAVRRDSLELHGRDPEATVVGGGRVAGVWDRSGFNEQEGIEASGIKACDEEGAAGLSDFKEGAGGAGDWGWSGVGNRGGVEALNIEAGAEREAAAGAACARTGLRKAARLAAARERDVAARRRSGGEAGAS